MTTMHAHDTAEMQRCIENCLACRATCLRTIDHCLRMGGKHTGAGHIRTMMDCAESCADMAATRTPY